MTRLTILLALLIGAVPQSALAQAKPITIQTLLNDLINRDEVARYPQPAYVCKQASSYDRGSKTPDDPKGWYANADASQFYGHEDREGRREWIMLDADGPGAIVRFWNTAGNLNGTIRIYIDGAEQPTVQANAGDLLIGKALADYPLAVFNGPVSKVQGGMNLYLPIPYAKHCKITFTQDDPKNPMGGTQARYYNIEYRVYPAGTDVHSFSMEALAEARPLIEKVNQALKEAPSLGGTPQSIKGDLSPGSTATLDLPAGPSAVRQLTLRITPGDEKEMEQALRTAIVRMTCDGEQTIWAPAGDFFASGVGLNEMAGWWRTVNKDGTMTCRWTMPYQKSASISIENVGKTTFSVDLAASTGAWNWDDRSMHFHSSWRSQHAIPTRPMSDWNYITITGKGTYLGDTLCVYNPVSAWWGEGDEHIFVDGQTFPSHFGTGTEDYYSYAWCSPHLFHAPFANQTRCDGPGNAGHTTVTRVRSLDAVPFEKSLRFDMEIWHWADCKVNYAATTYWYAIPGATSNRTPQPQEAAMAIPESPMKARMAKIPGAVECETALIVSKSPGLVTAIQDISLLQEGAWSAGKHLWVQGRRAGDYVELRIPAPDAQARKLTLYATRSWDYGILRFSVNGERAGKDYDSFNPTVVASGPIQLGVFEPKEGAFVVRVEVVGGNPQSKNSRSFFGLDCVRLEKP